MLRNIPCLAIRFDIDKAGRGYYGFTCWKTFWRAVDPALICGSLLFEGDTRATLDRRERVFLIALQHPYAKFQVIQERLAADEAFLKIAAIPAFASDPTVTNEPLIDSGNIDSTGNLVGRADAARSALGEIRREQRARGQEGTPPPNTPARIVPASLRTANLPDVLSLKELEALLITRCSPRDLYKRADIYISPQELCDVAERYESQLHIVYSEYHEDTLYIQLLWKNPRLEHCLQFSGLCSFPTAAEAIRAIRQGWEIPYSQETSIRPYVDAFPQLAGLNERFQGNFKGMGNDCLLKDYDQLKQIGARDLWPLLYLHAIEVGIPILGEMSAKPEQESLPDTTPSQATTRPDPQGTLPPSAEPAQRKWWRFRH